MFSSSNGRYWEVSLHYKFAAASFASSLLEVNQVSPQTFTSSHPNLSTRFLNFKKTAFPFRSKSKRKSESNTAPRGMIFRVVDRYWFMIINVKTDRLRTCKISRGQTCNLPKLFSFNLKSHFYIKSFITSKSCEKTRSSKKTLAFISLYLSLWWMWYHIYRIREQLNFFCPLLISFECKSYFTAEKISSHLLSSLPTNQISWINKMAACVYTSAWYVYSLVSYLYVMPCIS